METILDTLVTLAPQDPLLDLTLGSLVAKRVCELQAQHNPKYLNSQAWFLMRGYSLCCARADQLYLEMITHLQKERWGQAVPTIQAFLQMDQETKRFEHAFSTHPLVQAQQLWQASEDYCSSFCRLEDQIYDTLLRMAQVKCPDRTDILSAIASSRYDYEVEQQYQQYVSKLSDFMMSLVF